MKEYILQITSGRGPEECHRVVAKVLALVLKEASEEGIETNVVQKTPGHFNATLLSALVSIKGKNAENFIYKWEGTIQWISVSPYRKFHKRKNWFVGIQSFDVSEIFLWDEKQINCVPTRSSGPGGQHVNKTESAVRATHLPSGISVMASERRSQFQNKSEAISRLKEKVKEWYLNKATEKAQEQWYQHNILERGNAVRVFNERL
jgi:peptide chain release factor